VPFSRFGVQLPVEPCVTSVLSVHIQRSQPVPLEASDGKLTARTPDIRVFVHAVGIVPSVQKRFYVRVDIENRSPIPVFFASLSIALKTPNQHLFSPRDAVTGEYQTARRIEPGQSLQYFLDTVERLKRSTVEELDHVSVSDEVRRVYRSEPGQLVAAVKDAMK